MKFLSLNFLVLAGFNGIVWQGVIERITEDPLEVYFLDVGQGDSELIVFPDGVKVLIDGGPGKEILFELGEVLSPTDRYIDLVMITHAQLDHYGGIKDVIERYQIGAFIFNGEEGEGQAWNEFMETLEQEKIPIIILGEGDKINYKDKQVNILSPSEKLLANKDLNDGSLVTELTGEEVKILFTGDLGNSPSPILPDTERVTDVDYLVMESVYEYRRVEGSPPWFALCKRRKFLGRGDSSYLNNRGGRQPFWTPHRGDAAKAL